MPFYKWRGVDLFGAYNTGTMFAGSEKQLDEHLFRQGIALIRSKPARRWRLFGNAHVSDKIQFFRQLSVLVDAGVLLPQALAIVAEQTQRGKFKEVVFDLAERVEHGQTLTAAMGHYPTMFNLVMIQLVRAGEESGELSRALEQVCQHTESTYTFYTGLRSALLLPAMTLGFFFLVVSILFTLVIPRFADIFNSLGKDVPQFTQYLLNFSLYLTSGGLVQIGSILAIFTLSGLLIARTAKGRIWLDRLILGLPLVGALLKARFVTYFLQSLALLLDGGVPLHLALDIIAQTVSPGKLRKSLVSIKDEVSAGHTLSEAFCVAEGLFSPDLVAMVEVGQESDRLPYLLKKVADSYHTQLLGRLNAATTLIQPLLMVVLGLLVTLLVFSVYVPLMSLGSVI